jgi:glycogen synthase kinase 3 beta
MASASNGPIAAASSTTTTGGVGAPNKAGASGVEALPKEMQDMKIKDDRIDHSDDKVSIFSSCQQAIISAAFAHVV